MNMPFSIDSFVLDTGPADRSMKATLNRYRPLNATRGAEDSGYILLFAHGTGFHKESWEPAIARLFSNDRLNRETHGPSQILECWAIDCQNHGAAAPLNDEILFRKPGILTIGHYADAFLKLVNSGLLGVSENRKQKIVIIGHSAGAVGTVFSVASTPSLFDMLILIEPSLFAPELKDNMTPMYRLIEKTTPSRRAVWKSKDEAHTYLKSRLPWSMWDPRMLKLYTEHGLRPLPTVFQPDETGVTLICSPKDEAAAFSAFHTSITAMDYLSKICGLLPVHLILGARGDMFSKELHDSIHDPSVGRTIASVIRVPKAGHLIPQEKPDALADAIHSLLAKKEAKL